MKYLVGLWFLSAVYPVVGFAQSDTIYSCSIRPDTVPQIESAVNSNLPGNRSKSDVTQCYIDISEKSYAYVAVRAHIKEQSCTDKPWPLDGSWCADQYNYWANMWARLSINEGCEVRLDSWDVYRDGGPGGLVGDAGNLAFLALRAGFLGDVSDNIEFSVYGAIVDEMSVNPKFRAFCGK